MHAAIADPAVFAPLDHVKQPRRQIPGERVVGVIVAVVREQLAVGIKIEIVGVIVYAMPTAGCQMRSAAIPVLSGFSGLDKSSRLKLINKNIRTISRVIIEPRFRSLGLAVRLVKETMPIMNVPFVEVLAVMGRANPFFEKGGMTRYENDPQAGLGAKRLIEAFSAVGVDEQDLIDPAVVQQKLETIFTAEHAENAEIKKAKGNLCGLCGLRGEYVFIESEMTRFLQSYGQRRLMQPGIERTRFVLSKLTDSPVYYLWKNPGIELRI